MQHPLTSEPSPIGKGGCGVRSCTVVSPRPARAKRPSNGPSLRVEGLPPLVELPSPCYVIDLARLRKNMRLLQHVQDQAGCKIMLALKGFSTFAAFPHMTPYLAGCCASGVWEARLAREEFNKEVHTYSPAFAPKDIPEILNLTDHLVFNSLNQWNHFRRDIAKHRRGKDIHVGLRINPEHSTAKHSMYDPCAPNSRLGVRADQLKDQDLSGVSGFLCHSLCQQTSVPLEATIQAIEERFGEWLPQMEWFNFGGGHHITRSDYDVDHLIEIISAFRKRWNLQVYMEPGEAHVLNTGHLIASVLDVVENGKNIAILDVSATAHMPDVLEMPYTPPLAGAAKPGEKAHEYRLAAATCLSGDIIGDYSFDHPLEIGNRIVFTDQAQYTMVKTTTFNGVKHPSIALWDAERGQLDVVREFSYEDFRSRLG